MFVTIDFLYNITLCEHNNIVHKNGGKAMNMNLSESQTHKNLMRAFAGESQARNRYAFAALQAGKENLPMIEMVFNFTACQELAHAKIFYDFLKEMTGKKITIDGSYPVDIYGTTVEVLRASQKNEFEESEPIYPDFGKIAAKEGFQQIADKFNEISKIEKIHGERFGRLADLMEQGKLFVSDVEEEWMCLNCGYIHKSSEAPRACPVCSHKQGYFIRLALAPYTK